MTAVIEPFCYIDSGVMLHPTWHVRSHTVINAGAHIGTHLVTGNAAHIHAARIGNHATIGSHALIESNVVIYDEVTVHTGAFVCANTIVHTGAWIGPHVVILNTKYPHTATSAGERLQQIIGKGARIGGNATILPGVSVGEWALVGAGAVVTKDVAPYTIVAGNPARCMGNTKTSKGITVTEEAVWGTL